MILSRIRHYLAERGQASLGEIALHFDASPDAVRGMLEQWMRKGKVRRHTPRAGCGSSCNRCDPAATEIYEWVGDGARSAERAHIHVAPADCDR